MIENDYTFGQSIVYCDGGKCQAEIEVEGFDGHPPDYSHISEEIRSYGWTVKKVNGNWIHLCSMCNN